MKKRILMIICAVILLLFSAALMFYPLVSNYVNERYQSVVRTEYNETISQEDDTELQIAWDAAQEYNASLLPVQYDIDALQNAQTDYHTLLNLSDNEIMGYVEIPKISVYLPIYHGTGEEILDKGIGHLLGSSLPIGGAGTHTVLTGHSGVAGKRLFSDLDQMSVGDVFYLHVLDEVLAYEVTVIHTVEPYDTTLLTIQEDRDRCTLITCTPFGINTHRLLVQGDRVPYEESEQVQEAVMETTPTAPSTWEQQYYRGIYMGVALLALIAGSAYIICFIRKRRKRHEQK